MEIGKKLISSALAITTFAWLFGASIVPVASAQTSADLQAQISALLAQIAALQAQLNAGTGTGTSGYQFTRNLTVGSVGTDVKQLQMYLNSKGYTVSLSGAGSVGMESTYFGPNTKAALIKFQAANGISATGYFGPITRAKVNSTGGGVVVPPGTPGSSAVVISVTNPAAGTLVEQQSLADLAHFTFNGNYTVTGVTLKRLGISADTSLSNVFLFEGDNRLTDAASISAGSLVTFSNPNGLFSVNGNKTVSVKADLAASISGQTVGVQLVSYTISGGSPVTVNLSGNIHTVASATLAGVSLAAATGSGSTDPGNDILVWQSVATVSTRDVLLKRLALRQIGSINASDIRNFRLFVDGVQVGSQASLDSNGYVTFSNVGKALLTGARTIKVQADVVGGSGRTVSMSLRGAYDITVTDTQYNVNPAVTSSGGFPNTAASFTVNNGTISAVKATDSSTANVTLNGSDISLGKWTVTAYGEPVKVETLKAGFLYTTTTNVNAAATLRNGRLLINGSQYGSTATLTPAGTTFTTNFTVNPGSPATVEVRADIFDNDGTGVISATSSDTIKAILKAGSSNGVPQVSLTAVNVPSADVDANTVTVASGELTLVKEANYANRNVVVPQTAYKVADFNLSAGSAEDVTINTFSLTYATATGATFTHADLSDLYIKYGNNQTPIKATLSGTDSFSVNFVVAKNTTVPVEIYANVLSGNVTATHQLIVNLAITGSTASGQASNVSATAGQTLTAQTSGTYSAALDSSSPISQIVDDFGTVTTVINKLTATDDSYTISEVVASTTNVTAVSSIELWYDGSLVASKPANTSVTFSGLNLSLPANTNKLISLKLVMGGVGSGAGTSGSQITTAFDSIKRQSSGGTITTDTTDVNGNAMYVYKAIPTITKQTLPVSTLSGGAAVNVLAKWTVGSGGTGTIGWTRMKFAVTTSTNVTTLTSAGVYNSDSGAQVAGVATSSVAGTIEFSATAEQPAGNYELRATVGGTVAANDYVNTSITRPTAYAAPAAYATVAATGATFVWTDQAGSPHSLTSTDWNNDNLVSGLPTLTWELRR